MATVAKRNETGRRCYSRARSSLLTLFVSRASFLFSPFLFPDGYILCVNPRSRPDSRCTQWSFALKVISLNVHLPVAQPAHNSPARYSRASAFQTRNNCADFFVRLPLFPRTRSRYSFYFPFISASFLVSPVSSPSRRLPSDSNGENAYDVSCIIKSLLVLDETKTLTGSLEVI